MNVSGCDDACSHVFSDSVLCLGRIFQHPESNEVWKNRVAGVRSEKSYRDYDGINGESTEFEWNIFPGFTTSQFCGKINDLLSRLGETTETFTGRILFMSMFNDISCDRKGNKEECLANARVVKVLVKKFGVAQWSFIGPGSAKKWYSGEENSPQGAWDHIADEMLLEFAESGHPIFHATTHCPGKSSKAKDTENCRFTLLQTKKQLRLFVRIIISANQLSIYGAVANMCEKCESLHDRSGHSDKVMGQSIVLGEIKTVPLENDDPAYQNFPLQRYEERIQSLSQIDRMSKFCMDAGFISVVEVGQYFMTKDNG